MEPYFKGMAVMAGLGVLLGLAGITWGEHLQTMTLEAALPRIYSTVETTVSGGFITFDQGDFLITGRLGRVWTVKSEMSCLP